MSSGSVGEAAARLLQQDCAEIQHALGDAANIHDGVHRARKAIRRLRAALALFETDDAPLDAVDHRLRRLARGLSTLRDAHVIVEVAEGLGAGRDGWSGVIVRLRQRRDDLLQRACTSDPGFGRRLLSVKRAADALRGHRWDALRKRGVRAAVARSRRRVDKARRRAQDSGDVERLHAWRRRARRLRMQLDTLESLGLSAGEEDTARRKNARSLHRLTDALGRQQDLRMLRHCVRLMPGLAARSMLLQQIDLALDADSPQPGSSVRRPRVRPHQSVGA